MSKTTKIQHVSKVAKGTLKKALTFVKENKYMFIQLGLILIPTAVGYCNDGSAIAITPLQKPLKVLHDAFTGPIPGVVTGISAALGGCSWAMGWEQQVTQRCVKGVGGGAIAMGGGKFMDSMGIGNVSGCLF